MILPSHLYWKKIQPKPKAFWNGGASKTKLIGLLLGLSCLSAIGITWNTVFFLVIKPYQVFCLPRWHKCYTVLWVQLWLLANIVIVTGACNILVVVDETCRTDVFSKRIYLMKVILSCVTNLRLSLVAVKALCLVLTFFDLWYQIVLVCIVNFFQKGCVKFCLFEEESLSADMLCCRSNCVQHKGFG